MTESEKDRIIAEHINTFTDARIGDQRDLTRNDL